MLAAVFESEGKLVLKERPVPKVTKTTDVLIKVTGVGICGTDLHILQVPPAHPAKKGIIQGHEFTGIVAEKGSDVKGFTTGDHVLIDPHPGCGQCEMCRKGFPDRCIPLIEASDEPGHPATIGIFSDGAMASYAVVPHYALYKVDPKVPSHLAALAEPLACVLSASRKLDVQPGDSAVVLGAGPIGLLFTAVLKKSGASQVIVSEPSDYRRNVALEIGATRVVNPLKKDLHNIVVEQTRGIGADIVVEAYGPLLVEAINLARCNGVVLQFGHDELAEPKVPLREIVKKELTIHGGFIGRFSFDKVARILEGGDMPLEKIASHRMPLKDVHKGLELLRKQQALKIILEPEE